MKKVLKSKKLIIPSTKLKVVNVHKIQDHMDCKRLYFWKWVLNIVPKKLSLPFWFGTMVHIGHEILVNGGSINKMRKIMQKEDRKWRKKYTTDVDLIEEMDIQFEVAYLMLKVYFDLFRAKFKRFKILGTETKFRVRLKKSSVWFVGILDVHGLIGKNPALQEIKTAARVDDDYFRKLRFDKQINGYAIGHKDITKKFPTICPYTVFKKPGIRVRQNETVKEFLKRLEIDLYERKDFYYIEHNFAFGKQAVQDVMNDIECETFDMICKYDFLEKEELLNPECWARNDGNCLAFGACPYLMLCHNSKKYRLYFRFFMMRDIRHEGEELELDKKYAFDTSYSKIRRK